MWPSNQAGLSQTILGETMRLAAGFLLVALPLLAVLATSNVKTQAKGWFLSGDTSIFLYELPGSRAWFGNQT